MSASTTPHASAARTIRNALTTQKDIARYCGVAQSTVSRVLRGDPRVEAALAARIKEAIVTLGYDPSAHDVARRLVARRGGQRIKNHTVAIVFPGSIFQNVYFHEMARGITETLITAGYSILWVHLPDPNPPYTLETLPPALRRGEVDGIIVCLQQTALVELLINLSQSSQIPLPLVSMIRTHPNTASVETDDEAGAYAAMRHLLDLGHRHVLHFVDKSFSQHDTPLARRIHGVQRALREAGLSPDDHVHHFPVHGAGGWMDPAALPDYLARLTPATAQQHPVMAYLRAHPQITALFGMNDANILHAWAMLTAAGARVPEDYSLIGFDDTLPQLSADGRNLLTTVRLPLYEVGQSSARLLCDAIDEAPDRPSCLTLPTELVIRHSTAIARTP